MKYSIVVPIHNEAGNITPLHQEIQAVFNAMGEAYEIIYINDGSIDTSLAELKTLSDAVVIDLNTHYGQATALDAGFKYANGEVVVSMDGDGQNDPHDIPAMLEKLYTARLDVVAGWRQRREDTSRIKILTLIGRFVRRLLMNDPVHDTGCTLRVYRREAIKSLDLQGEMHRYILGLLRWKGFRIGEMVVKDRTRVYGASKYGMSKSVRGLIDLLFIWFIHKYSQRPLHFFGYASLLVFLIGFLFLAYAGYQKLYLDIGINRSGHFLLGAFSILGSLILFTFGVVIDLLIKIHLNNSPYEKRYYVREINKT
ncbi:MAG TPA: glycosyltransferase family 2 protein [Candidatus Paceibacterota bacterium]|nr:glycosyltransferase family 2 protein [Candidatus Paceibacterota bacterium]